MKFAQLARLMMLVILCSAFVFSETVPADGSNQERDSKASDANSKAAQDSVDRLDASARVLQKITQAPDNGIPQTVLSDAKCVAMVPSLLKGAFVFGARHGRGVATCRLPNGSWSAPAFLSMTGGSWGAQVGGQAIDLVMFFMTQEGADKLLEANWRIGAGAGVAAGPWGRNAGIGTSWKFNNAILTYSRSRGLFIGADLNGVNVHQDTDSTRAFYGKDLNYSDVLSGKVNAPARAHSFQAAVSRQFHEANASQ